MARSSGFSPRLSPRPKQASGWKILRKALTSHIRVPFLCALACKIFFPLYHRAATWFNEREWSERTFFCVSVTLVHVVLYFGMNSIFLYWDRQGIFERYKLDRSEAMGPTDSLIRKTWVEAAIGQLLVGPVALYYIYPAFKYFGSPVATAPLPNFTNMMLSLWIAYAANDILFYWAHRLAHSSVLYKRVHKQHHEYKGTIGFAAEYAGVIETITSNQIPTILGCLLVGCHFHILLIWLAARLEETYEAHSGYCFYGTWLHSIGLTNSEHTAYHDFHHTNNRGNFGGGDLLDHLFGTQDAWLAVGGIEGYIAKRRRKNALNRPSVRREIDRQAKHR